MAKRIFVSPGQTLLASGALQYGSELVVDAGTSTQPGGVIVVNGHAGNKGHVVFYGSTAPGVAAASATISATGNLLNQGQIQFDAAAISGSSASATIFGVLTNTGQIYLQGAASGAVFDIAAGGVLTNSGHFQANGGSVLNGSLAGAGATIIDAGTLTNTVVATLNLYGGFSPASAATTATGAVMQVTGVLTNDAGATVRIWGAAQGVPSSGLATGGSLDIAVGGYFDNLGVVDVRAVATIFSPGFGNTSTGGLLTVAGRMENSGLVRLDAGQGETGSTQQGATMIVTGVLTNNNSLIVAQGNDLSGPGGSGLGAMLLVEGTMINDRLVYSPYAGLMVYGSTGTIDPTHPPTAGTVSVSGTLDNVTGISLGAGFQYAPRPGYYGGLGALLTDSGYILNQSTIYVQAGFDGAPATFDITGTLTNDGGSITGGGVVINNGTINALHDSTIGAIGGNGLIDVAAGATLTLAGAVTAGQSISLAAGATLNLASPFNFQGVLTNISAGVTIDFMNLHIAAAHETSGALGLYTNTAAPLLVQLGADPAATASFSLVADGKGGTDLTFPPQHG